MIPSNSDSSDMVTPHDDIVPDKLCQKEFHVAPVRSK